MADALRHSDIDLDPGYLSKISEEPASPNPPLIPRYPRSMRSGYSSKSRRQVC